MKLNRVAIVTGCRRGRVGSHIAAALARRGYGVVLQYRTAGSGGEQAASELREEKLDAISVQADLTDEQQVRSLLERTLREFGRVDVLVKCAAAWKSKPLEEVTAGDVRGYFDANVLTTFLCCQHVGLAMTKQVEGGSIVTFGDWAFERPYANYAAYFPSKGAIPALTRTFAVELGLRNPKVRVNCVLPGPVLLPADLPTGEREEAIAGTLVKREGRPENIVQAVLHFIENDFVTGACLPVDGGRTIFAAKNS
jgi:pteridine reductase